MSEPTTSFQPSTVGKPIPFEETDKREYVIIYSKLNREVKLELNQIDLLKLHRVCQRNNMINLSNDLKKFIRDVDKVDGKETNFDREKLPKSILRK